MYTKVTFNLTAPNKRYEMLEGKRYLVVPAVALTVGVHNGNEGPLYYSPDELSKNPSAWNHKPVVIYHPMLGGDGISACDPEVINRQGVGLIFNSVWDGRLRNEVWLDEDKLRQVDRRVLDAINSGNMVEVSTGLWQDPDMTPGTWNGEAYKGTVHNIQPDHLAILPDQKGACSIADGAGLLRNAEGCDLSHNDIRDHVEAHLNGGNRFGPHTVEDVYPKHVVYSKDGKLFKHGYKVKKGRAEPHGEPEEVRKQTSYVTANEDHQGPLKAPSAADLSDKMRHQQMQKALDEHYSGITQDGDWGGWVTDLFANYAVYSKDGKLFRLPYTYDDDKVRFDGEPEELERVSEYRTRRQTPNPSGAGSPIDGTSSPYNVNQGGNNVGNPTQNAIHQGAHQMTHDATQHMDAHHAPGGQSDSQLRTAAGGARTEAVNKMIGAGHAKEEDRKYLSDLPDDHFERIQQWAARGYSQPIQPYSYEGIGDRSSVHGTGTHNTQQTPEQYIMNAPPAVREVLQNALVTHQAEKSRLVTLIMNSPANRFAEKWLQAQSMDMLRGMAQLAGTPHSGPVLNYSGQADVPMFLENAGNGHQAPVQQALPLPAMSFDKK